MPGDRARNTQLLSTDLSLSYRSKMLRTLRPAILSLAIAAASTAAIAVVPAASQAAGPTLTVTTSALDRTTSTACVALPITWYVSVPDGASNWLVDGDIIDSVGASRASIFEYEQAAVTQASGSYQLCVPEGVTTFRLVADVTSSDYTYPYTGDQTVRVDSTFTITRPAYVPPPPPAPITVRTTAKLGTSPTWIKRDGYARLGDVLKAKYPCGSYCGPTRRIKLEGLRAGRWAKIGTMMWESSFIYLSANVKYKYTKVRVFFPAKTIGSVTWTAATTNAVRVPRRP